MKRVGGGLWLLLGLVACEDGIRLKTGTPTFTDPGGSGAGTPAASSGSCDRRTTDSVCIDYRGSGWTPSTAESACGLDWVALPCPPSDLGGCQAAPTDPLDIITWYYQGEAYDLSDVASLQSQCEAQSGTWR